MTKLPWHFELIDRNKAKAHEDRQEMKRELNKFIDKCNSYELVRMYSEFKRLKREIWLKK